MRSLLGNETRFGRSVFRIRPHALGLELFYTMAVYYIFFVAILLSDLLFIASLVGLIFIPVPGPYREVWVFAYLLFVLEIIIALTREKEDTHSNMLLIALSYFTYCQLWIFVVLKGAYDDFIRRREHIWIKTQRFRVSEP